MKHDTRIVLSLGISRCGTTFLRDNFYSNIKDVNLIKSGFIKDFHLYKDKINIIHEEIIFRTDNKNLSCFCDYEKMIDNLDTFKMLFPDAKIIVGIRDKPSWFRSCYNEHIRGTGSSVSYQKFYEECYDKVDINRFIQEIKNRWKDVYVFRYEILMEELSNLCRFIGCDIPKYKKERINYSLSKKQIKVIRFFALLHMHYPFMWFVGKINDLKQKEGIP